MIKGWMAANGGGIDLRNTADNLDEPEPVANATPVEEWRAFSCTSVRALFEAAAARCEADDQGAVGATSPATPATQHKGRKVRAPRAALPLSLHVGNRASSLNGLDLLCMSSGRVQRRDAAEQRTRARRPRASSRCRPRRSRGRARAAGRRGRGARASPRPRAVARRSARTKPRGRARRAA